MSPEEIKDPRLRAKYEAAIAENERKADEFRRQYRLRQLDSSFPRTAEKYLIQAYSKPPSNLHELRGLLNIYQIDKTSARKILDGVSRN